MKNSIPRVLRLGFILGLFVLVISASIPYYNFTMLREGERWVGHTMQVVQAADALRIAVVDAESGQRGYLLTENDDYLQPFTSSQQVIDQQFDLLLELTADNAAQQQSILEIKALTQQKLNELQATIHLQQQGKRAEALQLVQTNEGRVFMLEIRQLLGEFQRAEKQELNDRVHTANTHAQRTLYSFLLISGFTFLLFAGLYLLILRNAQRRRTAEIALNHQSQLLGSIINNMSEGLYVIDTQGRPLLHNPVMEKIYDHNVALIKLEEWQSQYNITAADGSPLAFAQFPAVEVLNGAPESNAEIIINLDGATQPKIVRVCARKLINDQGVMTGVVCIFSDVSQQKKSELKLRLAMQQAESSSKAKSDFVANMSHEIRTPLNAIMGTAQILNKTELSSAQNKYVNMIVLSAQSLLTVLNDILDFSKIEAGKMELVEAPFCLSDLMQQLAAIMSMAAQKKNIELIINIDNALPRMLIGDANRLHQILVNFISNAIKFTESGEVVVAVKGETNCAGQVMLCCSVIDTGMGISPEQQERLFSPFIQADTSITRKFGGTGLGLTISRRLAELMGGSITMRSVVGQGSTFSVTVPFAVDRDVQQISCAAAEEKMRHLLVIDDNAAVRDSIANIISHWQWSADIVASVKDALLVLRQAQADHRIYDAILLDRQMPGIDEQESLQAIRATAGENCPIILMTNMYRQEESPTPDAMHPDGVIFKPVTSSTLFDALNELLDHTKNPAQETAHNTATNNILLGTRILLVEDNEFNQVVARDLLMHFGASVDIVDNGKKAVEKLRDDKEAYNIILMDVQMPVMDGFTATRILRQELEVKLPIIAMTAGVTVFERNLCIQSGMDDLIAKPIEADKMVAIIVQHTSAAQHFLPEKDKQQTEDTDGIFDIENLLKIGGDNPAHLEKTVSLVENLVKNTEANFANAKNEFALGHYDTVAAILHSLRGSLGIIGAKRLVERALQVEKMIDESKSGAVLDTAFQQVEIELMNTLAATKQWIAESR